MLIQCFASVARLLNLCYTPGRQVYSLPCDMYPVDRFQNWQADENGVCQDGGSEVDKIKVDIYADPN